MIPTVLIDATNYVCKCITTQVTTFKFGWVSITFCYANISVFCPASFLHVTWPYFGYVLCFYGGVLSSQKKGMEIIAQWVIRLFDTIDKIMTKPNRTEPNQKAVIWNWPMSSHKYHTGFSGHASLHNAKIAFWICRHFIRLCVCICNLN